MKISGSNSNRIMFKNEIVSFSAPVTTEPVHTRTDNLISYSSHSFVDTIKISNKSTLNFYHEKTNLEFIIYSCFKRIDFYNDSVLVKKIQIAIKNKRNSRLKKITNWTNSQFY